MVRNVGLRGTTRDPPTGSARFALILALAAVSGWLAAVGWCVAGAVLQLRQAADAAQDARAALSVGDLGSSAPEVALGRVAVHARRAERRSGSVLVGPLRLLPVAGRQLRSLHAIAGGAAKVGETGRAAATDAHRLIDRSPADPAARVALVTDLADLLAAVRADLGDIELGPDEALVAPLAERRRTLATDLEAADRQLLGAERAARSVRDLLAGPRRYLLLAANNAEMRAGSGMFLSASVLTTDGGRLSLDDPQRTSDLLLPGDGVAIADIDADLAARWGFVHPGREWRNLATTPRFDVTAPVAARMWTAQTGQPVDGVLAVDVPALAAILAATGPIEVDGARYDAGNVEDYLLHDQYEPLGDADQRTAAQSARREALGRIAGAATEALQAGGFDSRKLATGLLAAAGGRHVLAWSARPDEQKGWEAAGVAGGLDDDSLLVSLLNRGGNKLDRFVRPAATLTSRAVDGHTEVTVTVRLRNRAGRREVPYVAGPGPGVDVPPGTYVGMLTVTLPGRVTEVTLEGAPLVVDGPDGPTWVTAGDVVIPRGEERVVTVRFTLPGTAGSLRLEPSARVEATRWSAGERRFTDRRARHLVWTRRRSVTLG